MAELLVRRSAMDRALDVIDYLVAYSFAIRSRDGPRVDEERARGYDKRQLILRNTNLLPLNLGALRCIRLVLRKETPILRRRTQEHRGDLDPIRRLITCQQSLSSLKISFELRYERG